MSTWASRRLSNSQALRNSSRRRPLNDSIQAFCPSEPGSMNTAHAVEPAQSATAAAMSSESHPPSLGRVVPPAPHRRRRVAGAVGRDSSYPEGGSSYLCTSGGAAHRRCADRSSARESTSRPMPAYSRRSRATSGSCLMSRNRLSTWFWRSSAGPRLATSSTLLPSNRGSGWITLRVGTGKGSRFRAIRVPGHARPVRPPSSGRVRRRRRGVHWRRGVGPPVAADPPRRRSR